MNKSLAIVGLTICILTTGILILSPLFIGQLRMFDALAQKTAATNIPASTTNVTEDCSGVIRVSGSSETDVYMMVP